jgi:nitroreductase / dihydropteridine reductase
LGEKANLKRILSIFIRIMSSFLKNLEWRRAVKHFGNDEVDTQPIIRAMTNAPSSFGLQPYKIIAIRNSDLKAELRAAAYNQAQVTECDTLFVFCARSDVESRAEQYLRLNDAEDMRGMLMGFISYLPDKTAWAARQAYIALGFGLAACAELQIPSCPMEGFSPAEFQRILGLPDTLVPCVVLAVGSKADGESVRERFRFPEEDLVEIR